MTSVTVHTYTAAESGLWVNSYLLETETEVVLIDTSLLNSDIAALKARLAALRKPLAAVFVTHAHPDHFNGVHELVGATDIPVYATAGVAKVIREVAGAKRAQWGPVYGDEWPAVTAYPSVELADRDTVTVGGVTVTVRELGPGESHADSYLLAASEQGKPAAFVGDVAFHGTHPYVNDGHTASWLATLDTISAELADMPLVYPGHGAPTGPGVFAEQRRYLLYYREVVRRLAGGAPALSEQAKAELDATMQAFLPSAPLTWMINLGADAVAAELASHPGAAEPTVTAPETNLQG